MSIRADAQETPLTRRHLVEIAPPWTWAVALTSAGLLGALFVLSVAGRIDVVVRGSGVIRPAEGERSIVALRDGTIEYLLPGGTHVMKDQVLVRLRSLSAETELSESVREEIATPRRGDC